METFKSQLIKVILTSKNQRTDTDFEIKFNTTIENIHNVKFPVYMAPEHKQSLNDAFDEGFKKLHEEWVKKIHNHNK